MERIVKLVVSVLLLCVACVGSHSVWYDDTADGSTCKKPCVDTKQCITDIKCADNELRMDNVTVCGCCPGCVQASGKDEPCDPGIIPCLKGLECKNFTNETYTGYVCQKTGYCSEKNSTESWKADCEEDGTFKAIQCKGGERCFCTAPNGIRIFGFQWKESSANMTCACSRYVWELIQKGRKDVSIHCTDGGDFEELQCDNHLCWCADPRTGNPKTRVLPDTMLKLLPCYNETMVGIQYLRQCESMAVAKAHVEETFLQHGTIAPSTSYINCDYDGSYGSKQVTSSLCYCSKKTGKWLGSWSSDAKLIADVDCNCARDSEYFANAGRDFQSSYCSPNGNYVPYIEEEGGKTKSCLDEDGYIIERGKDKDNYKCSRE